VAWRWVSPNALIADGPYLSRIGVQVVVHSSGLRPLNKSTFGLLVVVVVGLLALVGLGSRSDSVAAAGGVVTSPALPVVFHTTLILFAVLALAVLAIIVYAVWPQGRSKDEENEWVSMPPPTPWWVKALSVAFVFLLIGGFIVAALFIARRQGSDYLLPTFGLGRGRPGAIAGGAHAGNAGQPGGFDWLALALATTILATVGLLFVILARSKARAVRPKAMPEEALSRALDEGRSALTSDLEPRRAVILAYAAMERSLAEQGVARRFYEAPFEYMGRVLGQARVSGQWVHRLTDLFELAKFSHHPIHTGMREDALDAVDNIQAELRAKP